MEWVVEDVTSENGSGNLEFSVKGGNEDDFFPTSVEFESGETPVSFSQSRSLRVSNYTIA